MLNDLIINYSIEFSMIVRALCDLIIIFFSLPLQIREARVNNGLRKLRYQLLFIGLVLFLSNNSSLFFLYDLWDKPQKVLNGWLQIINAITFLLVSLTVWLIYTQQYSDKNKRLHEKMETMENEVDKKQKKA